jgi:hypothetical protein
VPTPSGAVIVCELRVRIKTSTTPSRPRRMTPRSRRKVFDVIDRFVGCCRVDASQGN